MPHECRTFRVSSRSHYVEHGGSGWVLHMLDVEGEEDEVCIALRVSGDEEYSRFQEDFANCLRLTGPGYPAGSKCPECRDHHSWLSDFSDWVKAAYSAMDSPPEPVEDMPSVVKLSFESFLGPAASGDQSGLS